MPNNDIPENFDVYGQLWLAVLSHAISDACLPVDPIPDNASEKLRRLYTDDQWVQKRARMWIESENVGVGSILWICGSLNLDVEAVRHEYRKRVREVRAATGRG